MKGALPKTNILRLGFTVRWENQKGCPFSKSQTREGFTKKGKRGVGGKGV